MNLYSTKRDPDGGCSSGRGPPAESPGGAVATLAAASFAVVAWGLTPAATKLAVGEIDALTVGILRTVLAMAPAEAG